MAKRNSASVSTLNELHEAIALYMLERIKASKPDPDAKPEYDDDGNEIPVFFIPISASELQVMVTFLNNNKISATPDDVAMAALAEEFRQDLVNARTASDKAAAITKVTENDIVMQQFLS